MAMVVGADVYDLRKSRQQKYLGEPMITVVVPAYNEELGIARTLDSLAANSYANKEILVVDDGSRDRTRHVVLAWKALNPDEPVWLIRQHNAGKAAAVNNGIKHAKGELVMVLDADSVLAPNALSEVPQYFADPRVVMTAANVKILENGSLLSLVQRYEYLVGYRLKKALNVYNMEYIIGGVGSTFRKSVANQVEGYDTDTMTEDIDFTLKLLKQGNVEQRVAYAPTVIAYTESVLSFGDLVKQRFRWKYGRMQSFLKNRELFFASQKKYDKRLTWYQLPYSLWAEVMFFLEPFMLALVMTTILILGDLLTLTSVYLTTTFYVMWNIWTDESESKRSKWRLMPLSLVQYPLFFILTAVEYAALVKCLARLHQLRSSLGHGTWEHVARAGAR
jgi:cellulose synthase/poly-beta-1,6-N-acetylglucosamine synthase-like glycosyltransferase